MGFYGAGFRGLNNFPSDEEAENEELIRVQPPKSHPRSLCVSFLFSNIRRISKASRPGTHTSSGSGFQHFFHNQSVGVSSLVPPTAQLLEKEEGEWSETGNMDAVEANAGKKRNVTGKSGSLQRQGGESDESLGSDRSLGKMSYDSCLLTCNKDRRGLLKDVGRHSSLESRGSRCGSKGDVPEGDLEEHSLAVKPKVIRGVEAHRSLKAANIIKTRPTLDKLQEAMPGKKRNRQAVFLDIDEVKQAGALSSLSLKRHSSFPSSMLTRQIKETSHATSAVDEQTVESPAQHATKEQRETDPLSGEGNALSDTSDQGEESNTEVDAGLDGRLKKTSSGNELFAELNPLQIQRQGSWKQFADSRQPRNRQALSSKPTVFGQSLGNKRDHPAMKKTTNSMVCQDTSIQRLLREVTNDKFWHHPEDSELQRVPGSFESVEEYVKVFEPLLFEECRAQLYSTWEETTEAASRDAHIMVRVKTLERRERGWYDVVVLPVVHECKFAFKEGDAAILSSSRPSSVRSRRKKHVGPSKGNVGAESTQQVLGTVRRHTPIDKREPHGAVLHFHAGNFSNSTVEDDHILRKFQPRSVWHLTVLGSLATTQREYLALHAFRRLNPQMQAAILRPSPERFPRYEEQCPAMPDCFTPSFVEHLRRTFNAPQLAAIQWAAMHTAAGSGGATTRRQDPWPFTLVQGPPGTGKTHTVWGMLNVIHLVQYQRYYTALLKKLAPESYKHSTDSSSSEGGGASSGGGGSIEDVLQSMEENLYRTLPKLCPKPRMLVCAPSNAATDELLSRVLHRGFIDGEMRRYRPDVARVGVDSQSTAAQAVSVERRTEQLLQKPREEVAAWIRQLKLSQAQRSQEIARLQRGLCAAAAAGRSQGSVGVEPDVLAARDRHRDALLQSLAAAVESRDKLLVELSRLLIVEQKFLAGAGRSSFSLAEASAELEASFADEAEIVFTTLSSSGRRLFSRLTHGFDMVVIDEAAQAGEVAVLPPLVLGAARCVLVGDPQQLPATVISRAAGSLLYSRSLFERFQQAGCPAMLLSVQYRMNPQIRDFPSRHFYQGRLADGDIVLNLADELYYRDPLLKPYLFFDISHGRESHRGGSASYQNLHEARFCRAIYDHLHRVLKAGSAAAAATGRVSVGIITPYKLQLRCLQREFEPVISSEQGKDLYINTVDAFQGQERDVIIMSCVRASGHGVGFVADVRRMNVALTRARRALWVVGNANALVQSEDWAALIADAKSRKCYMDVGDIPPEFAAVPRGSGFPPPAKMVPSGERGLRQSETPLMAGKLPS
ncbi:unnamed protein product [Spirodela intermedia]|uniref:Uncharacterized protein n=1 Tax=Spirodela intermedia TaxID=51605 RepID=A0A7I8LI74_SPIIN|nr:unnamed protein product [Spirodela intermedia]